MTPIRFSGRPLLAKSRDLPLRNWRLTVATDEDNFVLGLNDNGEARLSRMKRGTMRLSKSESDKIVQLAAGAFERFAFALPRESKGLTQGALLKLTTHSDAINYDCGIEVEERNLDNNPAFKVAVQKLVDAVKAIRGTESPK